MIQYPNVMIMIISIFTIMIMISMRTTKVRILADSNKHLKLHAAESLSKLAKYKKVFADFMVMDGMINHDCHDEYHNDQQHT